MSQPSKREPRFGQRRGVVGGSNNQTPTPAGNKNTGCPPSLLLMAAIMLLPLLIVKIIFH